MLRATVAQGLGLGVGKSAVQEQVLGPGGQVDAGQGEFEAGGVDGEHPQREPTEPATLAWTRCRPSSQTVAGRAAPDRQPASRVWVPMTFSRASASAAEEPRAAL